LKKEFFNRIAEEKTVAVPLLTFCFGTKPPFKV